MGAVGRFVQKRNTNMKNWDRGIRSLSMTAALVVVFLGLGCNVFGRDFCPIQGTDGACSISLLGFASTDKNCEKFQNVKYIGACRNGLLEGVVLLRQSTLFNGAPFEWQQLSSFNAGIPDSPSVTYGKSSVGFTDLPSGNSGVCAVWSESIDVRQKKEFCIQAAEKYIDKVTDKVFWERVVKNQIDQNKLPRLRAYSNTPSQGNMANTRDDLKTTGRGARGD